MGNKPKREVQEIQLNIAITTGEGTNKEEVKQAVLRKLKENISNSSKTGKGNLTNRSVKIGIPSYDIMKRYAFERDMKMKDLLDEAILHYIEENIEDILYRCAGSIDSILEKMDE